MLGAVWAALVGSEGSASAWINCGAALGVAALVKPVVVVVAPAFFIFAALRKEGRWWAVMLLASPLALALAGVGCYNAARFAGGIAAYDAHTSP